MLRTTPLRLAAIILVNTATYGAQDPPGTKSDDDKTFEEAIDEATLIISERVNVVGSESALETIPGSAYVIDGEALEAQRQGFDDIHRMIRQVPGIVIQEEDGYGLRPNIGMRGTGSERSAKITLMEDGVLIAPAPYTAPSAYYFPVTGRMEAIEVRKGSSQIKFGPRTNGGALNLVSTSVPINLRMRANVALGTDSAFKGHINVGDSYENVGWLFETYQLRTNGFKELDGGASTGFYVQDYLGKLRFNTSPSARIFQSLELKVGAGTEDSNETYLGLTERDFDWNPVRRYAASQPDNIQWNHQQFQAQHFLAVPGGIDVTTTLYRNNFERNWYKLQSILGTDIGGIFDDPLAYASELAIAKGADSDPNDLSVRANARTYYSQGVQSVAGFKARTGSIEHDFELGLRFHQDQEDRFQNEDGFQMLNGLMGLTSFGAPGSQSNRVSDASALAFFAQDTIRLSRWTILPGVRYETIELTRIDYATSDPGRTDPRVRKNHVTAVIPGIGITYAATPKLNVFGGIHKGFSPPGPGSTEFTQSEESLNYELGLRGQRRSLGAELVFYYNNYSNLLGIDTLSSGGSGEGDLFNGGASRARGIEASLRYDFAELSKSRRRFPFLFSYTLSDAEFRSSFDSSYPPWGDVQEGDKLPYLARHQLYARFAVEDSGWSAGLDANYTSRMRTEAGQGDIPAGQGTDAYLVVNAFAEFDLSEDVRFFATVQNVGDNAYIVARRPAGLRPGLPRTFMTGIKLALGR
ncbi:MAG: TonB-dependent receptor [Acidobacteriota bacterium]|nr:MAG: TonB-dependent receptor [Acidobacteriota bacterium]